MRHTFLVLAATALIMATGVASAQEHRDVGVDEAAALARVLRADIWAAQKFFEPIESRLALNPDAKCAAEVDGIREHIHGAAYAHFEIRENYRASTVNAHFERAMARLRVASSLLAACQGPEAVAHLNQYRLMYLSYGEGYGQGQADQLATYINRRNAKQEKELASQENNND